MSNWPRCAKSASRPSARRRARSASTKPLGDYSEAEALQVIDAIVTCYTDAMVAHHEATKYPPVRGMPPTPDPTANPFADLEDDLPFGRPKGRSHDRLQLLIELSGQVTAWSTPGCSRPAPASPSASTSGASRLGVACERALQFEYAKAPVDHGRDIPGRMLRIFERGTSWRTAWSRGCGTRVSTCAPARPTASSSASRWPMAACRGTSTASSSAAPRASPIPRSGKQVPGQQVLARSGEKGLAVAKPVYAAQVAIYQAYLELHEHPAIFTALNADTMEIYTELVPFDAALAQRMSDRAVKVITATEAGELLPRAFHDPTHFECRMCAWQDRCWRTQA
jgi:hypothetical protein